MSSPLKLKIVVGSTREGRLAEPVAAWVTARATAHGRFAVDVLDLRDHPLPMFQETRAAFGGPDGPRFSDPALHVWNDAIADGDVFVMITPEYNHSVPGVLKNAIDSVFGTYAFRNKAAGLVGYSGGLVGGARAVEHLAHIAIEAELVPLRNTVILGAAHQLFGGDDGPGAGAEEALTIMLDDLAWWGAALRRARAEGELPTGTARRRTAAARS